MEIFTDYNALCSELSALVDGVPYSIANLANASALLQQHLKEINWVGFYILQGNTLVLGPFQGKPACIEIPVGKGVCGTAVAEEQVQRVADVHLFPGHIACDSASRSEIVIPLRIGDKIYGVLDIDSPITDRFSENDEAGLCGVCKILEKVLSTY